MLAGAWAGVMEHVSMFPVDTVKTRMMTKTDTVERLRDLRRVNHVWMEMRSIVKAEGFRRLWRGVPVVAAGAMPGHALYFATYEYGKELFGGANSAAHEKSENKRQWLLQQQEAHAAVAHGSSNTSSLRGAIGTSFAGALATFAQDMVMTPSDVVKCRIQAENSPYKTVFSAVMGTYRKDGLRAFFVSFPTTLMMNVPYAAVYFTMYEHLFSLFSGTRPAEDEEQDGEFHPLSHILAGAAAGGAAAAVTNPMDVVKTRLQLANPNMVLSQRGFFSTFNEVRSEGVGSFFKGIRARVLFHIPAAAICLTTYASTKFFLKRLYKEDDE